MRILLNDAADLEAGGCGAVIECWRSRAGLRWRRIDRIYWDFPHLFDEEARASFREEHFMPRLPNLEFTRTADQSRAINRHKRGAIVIAGSGMCNGGRILHHFRRDIGRSETQIVFTGFQPPGTVGRRIIDRAESVRIHGETYAVRAGVHTIGGLSAHADRDDLLRWYRGIGGTAAGPAPAWLVHGDPDATRAFQRTLEAEGIAAHAPPVGERVSLAAAAAPRRQPPAGQKL